MKRVLASAALFVLPTIEEAFGLAHLGVAAALITNIWK